MTRVLGIDVGGTKTAVGLVSGEGSLLCRQQIPTLAEEGKERFVARLVELCKEVCRSCGPFGVDFVGVGAPGPLDSGSGTLLTPPNLRPLWGLSLGPLLQELLGVPLRMENDANAAALAEHRYGAGRGTLHLVYLTLSTGIGGGIVAGGRLYGGHGGNAGEIGHMSVALEGPPCLCGGRGCLEALASGTALGRRAQEVFGEEGLTSADLVERVREGNPLAVRIWDEAVEALSTGLANVIHVFNPQRIVLGGGLTLAGAILFDPLRQRTFAKAMSALSQGVEILPAALGAEVGILGAAAVALDALAERRGQKASA